MSVLLNLVCRLIHNLQLNSRPFEIRDQRAFHFQPSLNMRKNNYILLVSNKEHSSAYSRGTCLVYDLYNYTLTLTHQLCAVIICSHSGLVIDDIWVVSSNSNFDHACVLRSYFYGPSANGEIEVNYQFFKT